MKTLWILAAAATFAACHNRSDEETGAATQLHDRGVDADGATAGALVEAVARAIDGAAWLALCGSLPPGLPAGLLATLVGVAQRRGVKVALDSSGAALVEGARARPDLLRINRSETEVLPGGVEGAMRAAPRGVVSDGAREIVFAGVLIGLPTRPRTKIWAMLFIKRV